MRKILIAAGVLATPALAQDWMMRSNDVTLSPAALTTELSGQTLVFYDDGRSVYAEDGGYSYTYGGGGTWLGSWRVEGESLVCVTFVTGQSRCDMIVENGERLVLLTDDGQRFPIRSVEDATPIGPSL